MDPVSIVKVFSDDPEKIKNMELFFKFTGLGRRQFDV